MIESLKATVLAEDTAGARGVRAEHGFSVWIEADARRILFDTGQGLVLGDNAEALGVDLSAAEAIVLSHGHYDHTGGLIEAAERAPGAELFAHPRMFEAKFHAYPGRGGVEVGAANGLKERLESNGATIKASTEPMQVVEGVWMTGEVPRRHDFEDTGGPFFLDAEGERADMLLDDQALFVEMEQGTVVFFGCAHAGVINTLDYISELTKGRTICAVYGGFHLGAASDERIKKTLAALGRHDLRRIGPCHCTGPAVVEQIREAFGERFVRVRAGVCITEP